MGSRENKQTEGSRENKQTEGSKESPETEGWLSYGAKVAAGVVTGIGLLACAAAALSSSGTEADRKKMKAPGQDNKIIDRAEFDGNPKKYFQDLRKK
jgi:hypothetical protein